MGLIDSRCHSTNQNKATSSFKYFSRTDLLLNENKLGCKRSHWLRSELYRPPLFVYKWTRDSKTKRLYCKHVYIGKSM